MLLCGVLVLHGVLRLRVVLVLRGGLARERELAVPAAVELPSSQSF
jgi:hypothetical protein